jgi:hypothetical protein
MTPLDLDQPSVDELSHVVRQQRLWDLEQRQQLALADLRVAATQDIQDLDAQRLSQRLRRGSDPLRVK